MRNSPVLQRIDFLTVLCGVLLCDGSYIWGEYQMYVAHHGYQMHHFIAIGCSIQFFLSFVAVYTVHTVPFHRLLAVFLVSALSIYLAFVAYVNFFSFRSDPSTMNFW